MTTSDLQSIVGLPSDVVAVPITDMTLYQNPDPRGPCGAKINQPDLSQGQGIGVHSADIEGFEFVLNPPQAQAKDYMDAVQADLFSGCASYDSRTNTGAVQHVQDINRVTLDPIADQAEATLMVVTAQGVTEHAAEIVIRRGNEIVLFAIFSVGAISPNTVQDLAKKAASRLTTTG